MLYLKELGEKGNSWQVKVESKASRPSGENAFDREIIVIFQSVFYHTGT